MFTKFLNLFIISVDPRNSGDNTYKVGRSQDSWLQ